MSFKLGVLLFIGAHICATMALAPCACTREFRPTCGSDGKTYSNPCTLRCAAFTTGKEITISKQGDCDEPSTTIQEACICTYDYKPVCANDGTTYPNECSLNCDRKTNPSLKMDHPGKCGDREQPVCMCTLEYKPVCGSDGNTYGNKCSMNCAARDNLNLKFAHEGVCDNKVKVVSPSKPHNQWSAYAKDMPSHTVKSR